MERGHSAALKRKKEAETSNNAMANAIQTAQLQGEEELKGLLKTAYFLAENELANSKFHNLVKFMKEMECPSFKHLKTQAMEAILMTKHCQKCTRLLQVHFVMTLTRVS